MVVVTVLCDDISFPYRTRQRGQNDRLSFDLRSGRHVPNSDITMSTANAIVYEHILLYRKHTHTHTSVSISWCRFRYALRENARDKNNPVCRTLGHPQRCSILGEKGGSGAGGNGQNAHNISYYLLSGEFSLKTPTA